MKTQLLRLSFILLLLLPIFSYAGDGPVAYESTTHVGQILKIYPVFPERGLAVFKELNFIFPYGPKDWHKWYNNAEPGCALIFGYLGNNAVLGNQFALLPNIAFETRKQNNWGFQTKIGMGISYFNKPYDINTNPANTLIGSSLTNITFVSFNYRISLSEKWNLYSGASFFHFSNGHYTLPNIGINAPEFNIGLKYYPKGRPQYIAHDTVSTNSDHKIRFNLFSGIGRHEYGSATKATGGPKYFVYQAAAFISKRYGSIHNWQAGFLTTYYDDYYKYIVDQEVFSDNKRVKAFTVTPFVGHEFIMNHIGLLTQIGINAYNPFYLKVHENDNAGVSGALRAYVVTKLGIEYFLNDPTNTSHNRLYVGIYIKAYFAEADYAQFGMGYSF